MAIKKEKVIKKKIIFQKGERINYILSIIGDISLVKIEKNIPIKKRGISQLKIDKFHEIELLLAKLEVGDSFFIESLFKDKAKISSVFGLRSRKMKIKVICRGVIENEIQGIRIHRIK